jgi:hypothetical protein
VPLVYNAQAPQHLQLRQQLPSHYSSSTSAAVLPLSGNSHVCALQCVPHCPSFAIVKVTAALGLPALWSRTRFHRINHCLNTFCRIQLHSKFRGLVAGPEAAAKASGPSKQQQQHQHSRCAAVAPAASCGVGRTEIIITISCAPPTSTTNKQQ